MVNYFKNFMNNSDSAAQNYIIKELSLESSKPQSNNKSSTSLASKNISSNKSLFLDVKQNKVVTVSPSQTQTQNKIVSIQSLDNAEYQGLCKNFKKNYKPHNIMRQIINFNNIIANKQSIVYKFNNGTKITTFYQAHVIMILNYFFSSIKALISQPVFIDLPNLNLIKIRLCFYQNTLQKSSKSTPRNKHQNKNNTKRSRNSWNINYKKFQLLAIILSKLLQKTVVLEFVQVSNLYSDPSILAQALGSNSKRIKFRRMMSFVWKGAKIHNTNFINKKKIVPSLSFKEDISQINDICSKFLFPRDNEINMLQNEVSPIKLTGLKVRLAGRLTTEKLIPRKTVKIASRGTFSKNKINSISLGTLTTKNKRGAYAFTVGMSQSLINHKKVSFYPGPSPSILYFATNLPSIFFKKREGVTIMNSKQVSNKN